MQKLDWQKNQFSDKFIIAHWNINLIRKKSDSLFFMEENNADILLISETKLYDSFPPGQFKICRFSMPYRYDRYSMDVYYILEMTFQLNF